MLNISAPTIPVEDSVIDVKDIDAIIGAEVMDTANDRIGRVSQVYIDSEDQHPSWVSVRTGRFGRSETLIPIDDARWESSTLFVQVDRAKVREAPHVDPDQELSVEEQTALYRYYGKARVEGADGAEAADGSAAAPTAAEDQAASEAVPDEQPVSDPSAIVEPAAAEESAPVATPEQQAEDTAVAETAPVLPESAAPEEPEALEPVESQPLESTPDAAAGSDAPLPVDDATPVPADANGEAGAEQTPLAADAAAAQAAAVLHRSNYVQPSDSAPGEVPADQQAVAPETAAEDPTADQPVAEQPSTEQPAEDSTDEPADAAPAQPEVITRYEERLRIGTERVPASRIRLVKRIVTEHHTVAVPVSHEELHIEREPIGEDEIANWDGPLAELQEEEREIVLMAERPVVSTHTAPIERIRLVREIVSGTHDVEADLRHEQFDVNRDEG